MFTYILIAAVICLVAIGLLDAVQRKVPVRRVYPLIGRIPPAIRHIALILRVAPSDLGPFSSDDIAEIESRASSGTSTSSFGTSRKFTSGLDRTAISVALLPSKKIAIERITVGGNFGPNTISVPILNFGALGYGPVNERVIQTFAKAASELGCLQNTGEDGLTKYHLTSDASLIWQIGTGYWGCRDEMGRFSPDTFAARVCDPSVSAIELKLSQGAKPGAGGLMPAAKNTKRVARVLGVRPGTPIVSPPTHSAFTDIVGMLNYLSDLADLSKGLPIGLKLCLGSEGAADELTEAFISTGIMPDFISLDGAEGGTGAAPTVLQDHAGLSIRAAVAILDQRLRSAGLRQRTRIFAAGAIKNGFDLVELIALGADAGFIVRAPLVAIGCVQARECHTGRCPSGLATHQPWRIRAISPEVQSRALIRYYYSVLNDVEVLLRAAGLESTKELKPEHLVSTSGAKLAKYRKAER